ncbi:MAG: hypothetical protein GXP54_13735 [Deltaproteobacteria bacterium]|nr:hypothetical protein [Deltaproteobacteria bacterium]
MFVFRHPQSMNAVYYIADNGLLFALKVAHERLTPAQAASESGLSVEQVNTILSRAARMGLVILPA